MLGACQVADDIVTLELPDIEAVPQHPPEQTYVFDANGNELAVLRYEFRERAALDEMPASLRDAVVVAEDQRFWSHAGLDARAIVRAALVNVAAEEVAQGGSTITQQLVKNVYLSDAPRTPATKLREAILARQLEDEVPKEAILEDYLNTVYLGSGAYGVQAAAWTYWRKDVADLALHEATLLAAIIRSPESLNPHRNPDGARARRDHLLDRLAERGLLTAEEADRAKRHPVRVEPRPPAPETVEPHWVDFVVRTLLNERSLGDTEAERAARLFGGGLRIHTTLRPDLQAQAVAARDRFLPDPTDPEVAIAAVVPETGEIVAAVGGRDYGVSQFDLATQGLRQPGSTFKTFVLAAAVTSGMGPDHRVNGNQGRFQLANGVVWNVRNYDRSSYGTIRLEEATRASVNGAFARLILELGVGRITALAHAMGIETRLNQEPTIALGGLEVGVSPLEMAAAYATLANLGEHVPVSPVSRIETASGEVVWRPNRRGRRALDPSAAFVVTRMLQTAVERGTGTAARILGWQVAGKTGTTDNHTDAWFVGYTPTLSVSVWIGRPEAQIPLHNIRGVRRVTGGSLPARIWQAFVSAALAGSEPHDFHLPPEYYEVVAIDPVSGLRAWTWCAGEEQVVPRVLVPRETCPSPPPPPPPPPSPPPGEPCPPEPEGAPSDEEATSEEGAQGEDVAPDEDATPDPAPQARAEECPDPAGPQPGPVVPSPAEPGSDPQDDEPTD